MSYPVYTIPAGGTLYNLFGSYAASTGAPSAATNFALADILVYKNGGTTQRSSTNGFALLDTDGLDFDGTTGINGFSIDTSDNTDAGFYTVGAWFHVVIGPITIDGQTVSFVACAFRIAPAESSAAVPKVDVSHLLGLSPVTATGTVVSRTDDTHIAIETGKTIYRGGEFHARTNTGARTKAIVRSYDSGTGDLVFEAPGLQATVDNTTTYEVFAGVAFNPIETGADDRVIPSDDWVGADPTTPPAVTASIAAKIDWICAMLRNKRDNDGTTEQLYADDAATPIAEFAISSAGGTVTKGEATAP